MGWLPPSTARSAPAGSTPVTIEKAAKSKAPYATTAGPFRVRGSEQQRRGAAMLRNFSKNNEWVRRAINTRKRQISQAQFKIVRVDDPKQEPNPAVDKKVRQLLKTVNPLRESFATLLDKVLEDLLVLDAGCIEKEKTLGGGIVGLYAVDGSTIQIDPAWDGRKPNAPRYSQWLNYVKVADFKNDELIYMMATPTTYSVIGWSPVETLIRVIEAELYGEDYDFEYLKQTAPEGMLYLGAGVLPDDVEAFREYYKHEIAGQKTLAIFGGGEGGEKSGAQFIPFKNDDLEKRLAYKKWLALKIAAVFEIDPQQFGLVENVNKANGENLTRNTDDGMIALANRVSEFITREIVWEIDEDHGFEFCELTQRDEAGEADVDSAYINAGVFTVNEVRARKGLDPVDWGDAPYVPGRGPYTEPQPQEPQNGDEQQQNEPGSAKSAVPFVAAARTRSERPHYLANLTG